MNPNHDPKTGEFSSGSGDNSAAHAEHRSVGSRVLHGAAVAAKIAALATVAIAGGSLIAAASQRRRDEQRRGDAKRFVRNSLDAMPNRPGLRETLSGAHIRTLRHPAVRAAHQHGLINPRRG